MKIEVKGKNGFRVTDSIRKYVETKLKKLDRFTTVELEGVALCKAYSDKTKVEITIPIKVVTLRAEVEHKDLYAAIDLAVDKLESQIKKNRHKMIRSLQEKSGVKNLFIDSVEPVDMVNSAVKKKLFKLEVMTFDEAVTQMELLGHEFYVYKNENDQVCIAYLRNDNEYGLIETI